MASQWHDELQSHERAHSYSKLNSDEAHEERFSVRFIMAQLLGFIVNLANARNPLASLGYWRMHLCFGPTSFSVGNVCVSRITIRFKLLEVPRPKNISKRVYNAKIYLSVCVNAANEADLDRIKGVWSERFKCARDRFKNY